MLWSPFAVVETPRQILHQKLCVFSASRVIAIIDKQHDNPGVNIIVKLFREKVEGLKQSL
jgi:hypothetical protein